MQREQPMVQGAEAAGPLVSGWLPLSQAEQAWLIEHPNSRGRSGSRLGRWAPFWGRLAPGLGEPLATRQYTSETILRWAGNSEVAQASSLFCDTSDLALASSNSAPPLIFQLQGQRLK